MEADKRPVKCVKYTGVPTLADLFKRVPKWERAWRYLDEWTE